MGCRTRGLLAFAVGCRICGLLDLYCMLAHEADQQFFSTLLQETHGPHEGKTPTRLYPHPLAQWPLPERPSLASLRKEARQR